MPISKILEASLESGLYIAKAWVSFNGTGTVAIRASGNVSSITDNGTGSYTVNFTTAMPDANYGVCCTGGAQSGSGTTAIFMNSVNKQTTSVLVSTRNGVNVDNDYDSNSVSIFR